MAAVTIHPRIEGLWRVRVLAWLMPRLLKGVTFRWRIGQGSWHEVPLQWHVDIDVTTGG